MKIEFDTSEVDALSADLRGIDARLVRHLRPVLVRGAVNIKNQLREEASASTHFKGFSPGISFEESSYAGLGGGELAVDIGPEKGAPGSLANIAYFGTSRGGGTVPDPRGALEAEAPKFAKALGDIAEDLL